MQETMQETPKQSDIEVDANRSEPQKLEPPYSWRELSDEEIKSLIPYFPR